MQRAQSQLRILRVILDQQYFIASSIIVSLQPREVAAPAVFVSGRTETEKECRALSISASAQIRRRACE